MSKVEFVRRYAVFVFGLLMMAFGISFCIRADLGVTPISCPPYVLSLGLKPTVGQFTIMMHIVMIAIQVAILRRKFPKIQYLQVVMGIIFGFFIDFAMMLTEWMSFAPYWLRFLYVLVGSGLVAVGVVLEVTPKVLMIAGEGLMTVLARLWNFPFGKVKIGFDCTLVLISIVFSLWLFGDIRGVREGTLVSAFLVGFCVGRIQPRLGPALECWMSGREKANAAVERTIITISREYGSGGHEVGEKLAKRLGWTFYDREIVNMTVDHTGLPEHFVEQHEQRMTNLSRLWKYITMDSLVMNSGQEGFSDDDRLFIAQSLVVKRVAARGHCVIVGRCADVILKDDPRCFNVFIKASHDFKCRRVMEDEHVSANEASRDVERVNKLRSTHYGYYTGSVWGNARNYDLCLDTSEIGIDGAVFCIADTLKNLNKK